MASRNRPTIATLRSVVADGVEVVDNGVQITVTAPAGTVGPHGLHWTDYDYGEDPDVGDFHSPPRYEAIKSAIEDWSGNLVTCDDAGCEWCGEEAHND